MTDTTPADQPTPVSPASTTTRPGWLIPVAAAGTVLVAGVVTLVLIVSLSVIGSGPLPSAASARALLTAADVRNIPGVEIDNGGGNGVTRSSLATYVKNNPLADPATVRPSQCAENLEGWLAWAALDTTTYSGWKRDSLYQARNIVVDSTTDFGPEIQQSRNFVTVAAATAFMNAQRAWYRQCAVARYIDPGKAGNSATFAFAPIPVRVGLDSIVEGSTDHGRDAPPHLVDVYLRNRNIVSVFQLTTNTNPAHGLDPVSLAILRAAANKLRSVG